MDGDLERFLAGLDVSSGHPSRRAWLIPTLTSGFLIAAICVALLWHFLAPPEQNSIAVMPFGNSSPDPADRYFSDSLTGEITESLAHVRGLKVITRSSASEAKARMVNGREAGRALHVASVLEGSIRRSGDRLQVVARLQRVSDGALLWSNTFDRRAADLLAIQSELTAGVARNLRVAGGISAVRHVPDAEAHELVMKARYEMQQLTPDSLSRAETHFNQAIARDPQYAEAYSGLASAEYNRSMAKGSTGQTEAERRAAEQMAHKALTLDPDLSAARAILATLAMQYDWDWSRAEQEYQRASAAFPSAAIEGQYIYLLLFRGRFAEADQHIRRLLDLDPFSTVTMVNVSLYRDLERRYPEAREISQRIAAQYPAMLPPQQVIGHTWLAEGHPERALQVFRPLEPRFPQIRVYEAQAYVAAGRRDEALRLILPFEQKYPDPGVPVHWFAAAYASMGDEANALKWLERSADRHEWQILSIAVNPVFANMRNSPGFRAIRKRIGLAE
jgi:serine/threonine-protein kinase